MDDAPLPPAIPAATLILLREAAGGGAPEILFVERTKAMVFAPGMLVFPGGRIDEGDRVLAASLGGDADDDAARIAAVRETVEEVGIGIGLADRDVPALRAALAAGVPIGDALGGRRPDLSPLIPFARWRPAHRHLRIYDTRFYLARLPADAPAATVDGTENVRLFWATAAAVLAMCEAGEATIIFPTRRNLERLARHASIAAIEADARAHPVETVTPWVERRGGVEQLCIPEGIGYPVTAEPLDAAMRG